MRAVITATAIFILIIILVMGSMYCVANSAQHITAILPEVERALYNDDWETAREKFQQAEEHIEKSKKLYEMLFEHDEVDAVQESRYKAASYLMLKNKEEALVELAQLDMLVKHLPAKDKITISNIL